MKLAKLAFLVTLLMLALMSSVTAQTLRTERDPRNIAPTVGTGGTVGGPTGLFTVYDGQTLRRGEWTLSIAYSNYDRDPGNVDITEVPLSFQIGLNDYLELFFTTDGFRALKVNSPRNLSSFYLPNSQLLINGALRSGPAIVQAPQGAGTSQFPGFAIFRPTGTQPFVQFPYVGGASSNFQFSFPSGGVFGFPANTFPTLGTPQNTGASANFPGIGSVYGGILPGVVLATTTIASTTPGAPGSEVPLVFTVAPTYLPDAPFINRTYGTSAFGTLTAGAKWRWTGPNNPIGVGVLAYYQYYLDQGDDPSGWNQMQRGASAGGSNGDVAVVLFGDARVRKWMNISANLGYKYTSKVKAEFQGGEFTVLDRPDELYSAFAVDFPVNKFFQPILEFRSTQYVGGRTPNAFENSPMDGIAGVRVFPTRWMSLGAAYRYNFNQQDRDSFDQDFTGTVTVSGRVPSTITTRFTGVPNGFQVSNDPHGFIFQLTAGRRNERIGDTIRQFANVDSVTLSSTEIVLPCPPGTILREGARCPEGSTITVGTRASSNDPTDVLTYNYTVSGGRIVGSGANVTWDLSGVRPGTYTITAGADNGCGLCGTTKTETITVRECPDCISPCVCPTIDVSGGGVVEPGQALNFTANVSGGTATEITYNWTVSTGTIASGQGTPSITVDTVGLDGQNVTATVEVGGAGLCETCARTDSETGSVTRKPIARLFDEFGPIPNDEVKARIQNLYVELGNNPGAQGYIINYGTDREVARREKQIRDAITFLNLDASRVTMVNGGANPRGKGVWTKVWIVPAGADNPTPDM